MEVVPNVGLDPDAVIKAALESVGFVFRSGPGPDPVLVADPGPVSVPGLGPSPVSVPTNAIDGGDNDADAVCADRKYFRICGGAFKGRLAYIKNKGKDQIGDKQTINFTVLGLDANRPKARTSASGKAVKEHWDDDLHMTAEEQEAIKKRDIAPPAGRGRGPSASHIIGSTSSSSPPPCPPPWPWARPQNRQTRRGRVANASSVILVSWTPMAAASRRWQERNVAQTKSTTKRMTRKTKTKTKEWQEKYPSCFMDP